MRVVFMGTPPFAVPSLEALVNHGHRVLAVYTQPDRPKGRGQEEAESAVKRAAKRLPIPEIRQPLKVRAPEVVSELAAMNLDAVLVVGYGQLIPQSIIDLPRLGIINVHASLLPRHRGAAPIQWAIASGDPVTGVTTMKIDAGLDTGDILLMTLVEIREGETAPELSLRLADEGALLLIQTLEGLEKGTVTPRPQDGSLATIAPQLKKEDGLVDWKQPAKTIYDRARGFQPWPGAWTYLRGQRLNIMRCSLLGSSESGEPWGTTAFRPPLKAEPAPGAGMMFVAGKRLFVACGDGSLELHEVQLEGRKRVSAEAFLNGQRVEYGECLGSEKI
jgi:methionyl-tRNA formyltransferase